MEKENVVNKKGMSSRSVSVRDIVVGSFNAPLYPGLQISGMTNGASGGFTLIELLVVVLIIGILAAVAVPQYQKAVLKSQMMETVVLGRTLVQAQQAYHLANSVYATNLDELGIDFSVAQKKYNFVLTQQHAQIWDKTYRNKWFFNFFYNGTRYGNGIMPTPFSCAAHKDYPLENKVCANITGNTPNLGNNVWNEYFMK